MCHGNDIWPRCGDLVAYRLVAVVSLLVHMQVSVLLHTETVLHYVARLAGNQRLQSALSQGHSPSASQQRKSTYSLGIFSYSCQQEHEPHWSLRPSVSQSISRAAAYLSSAPQGAQMLQS